MKRTLLAITLAFAASSAVAGSAEKPGMDVTVITQSASGGTVQSWVVPAAFAALAIILLANLAAPGTSTPASF